MDSDFNLALPRASGTPYEIERVLGRGGMATVYLANDRKHDRRVAIKVLHAELSVMLGTERFLREIRVIANLQHPNILGLIDSGVFDPASGELEGRPFYVMPFVDGETLRARLDREGQLPVADALRIAKEIASALDYAHRRGVVHRDVKPENILLQDGRALVADFGIALAVQQAGGDRMTQTGLSLGTPQYMSPEQATGERTVGARSDVYALGAVLYEMLVGEPPFTGPNMQAIVARVLADTPRPLVPQRPTVPVHVESAIIVALQKIPADRFASAAEFARALDAPAQGTGAAAARPATERRVSQRALSLMPWAISASAVAIAVAAWSSKSGASSDTDVRRLTIMTDANSAWVDESGSSMALSPDGSVLIYRGRDSAAIRRLYVRRMDQLEPQPLRGGSGSAFPIFSPDGRSLAFIQNGRYVRMALDGGSTERLCETGGYVSGTWLENGTIVFASTGASDTDGLRICGTESESTLLIAHPPGETLSFPHALPGGRALLASTRRGAEHELVVVELASRTVRGLGIAGSSPSFVTGGYLVYAAPDGTIRRVGFDPSTLRPHGAPEVVLDDVPVLRDGGVLMAISRSGTVVSGPRSAVARSLEYVDRDGRASPALGRTLAFGYPRFSPDGRRVALSLGDTSIWVLDRSAGSLSRVTFDSVAIRPVWSRDGRHLVYVHPAGSRVSLRRIAAHGGAPAEDLLAMPGFGTWAAMLAPDGRHMVVRTVGGPTSRDMWLVDLQDPKRTPVPLIRGPSDEVSPTVSPDGRWIAYASNESGRFEVYVQSFPAMEGRQQISVDGGTEPVWSPLGDELFYRAGPTFVSASVRAGATLEVLGRTALFSSGDYLHGDMYQEYDITPDGRTFVMVRTVSGPVPLTATLNLFGGSRRTP